MLDESAHVYKQILLDEQSRPITRHQIWLTNIKAYDNTIPPGRSDIARFRFRMPNDAKADEPVTLRARVNYRRLNQEYTNYVLRRQRRELTLPVVRMAEAAVKLTAGAHAAMIKPAKSDLQWKRWNDYGIGLLEQAQYGQAAEAFRRASAAGPNDPTPIRSRASARPTRSAF